MITIIDYGVGNLSSIKNMLKRIGVAATITNNLADIEAALNGKPPVLTNTLLVYITATAPIIRSALSQWFN